MASVVAGLLSGKAAQELKSTVTKSATNAAQSIFNDMCPDISSQVDNLRTADQKHKICKRPFGGPTFYVNDEGHETIWSAGMGKKKRSKSKSRKAKKNSKSKSRKAKKNSKSKSRNAKKNSKAKMSKRW